MFGIVPRRAYVSPSLARRRRRRPLVIACIATAAILSTAPRAMFGPAHADVPVENITFFDKRLEEKAKKIGTLVNDCDSIDAGQGIAELEEIVKTLGLSFAGAGLPPQDLLKLPDLIKLLKVEFAARCGPNVFEFGFDIGLRRSYGFFVPAVRDYAKQQLDAVKACADVDETVKTLRAQEENIKSQAQQRTPQQGRAQLEADARSLGQAANWLAKNKAAIEAYKAAIRSAAPQTPGVAPGGTPAGTDTPAPGTTPTGPTPPGAPTPPGQPPGSTRKISYDYPNGAPFVAVIEGGAYWHEIRQMKYGIIITNPGVPGSERGNVRSEETLSGGSLALRVSVPGSAIGLWDEWRAMLRLSGQWADGAASNTVLPGGATTARRYFFAVPSTGVNYGATGQHASAETDFHRFGFDASLGRNLGTFQIGGGRLDLRAAAGVSYQYTHVSQQLAENNLTFSDIWSMAGFYSTDHVIGPHIGGSAAYTNGPFRASAKLQFLPGVVFGSGNGYQQNVCGGCPPAEQNFTQTISASRTAFNARVLFAVDGSYRVLPGLNVGWYFNLNYNSSASAWRLLPNPLKGPPTLRGSEDFGYGAGVKLTILVQ